MISHGRKQLTNSRRKKYTVLACVGLAGFTAWLFAGCTAIPVDYSAYSNVNLIPNGQFAANAATPGLGWSLDNVDAGLYNNVGYAEVVSAAGANTSADTWAGYGTNVISTSLTAATGTANLPIYRLETKNLFINGDFEAGNITAFDTAITQRNRVPTLSSLTTPPLSTAYDQTGNWMEMNFATGGSAINIPLATNITGYNIANPDQYSISFAYILDIPLTKYLSLDNATQSLPATGPQPSFIAFVNSPENVRYRFPFTSLTGSGSPLLIPSSSRTNLYINTLNPQAASPIGKVFTGTFDDFQLVRSDLNNAVRLDIPWTSASRADLQPGGHYTVKLWVRQDMTANYAAGTTTVNNRFKTDFISISLHQYLGSTSTVGAPPTLTVHSVGSSFAWALLALANGWTNHSDLSAWTEITASFAGPATATSGLQLAISTTNMASASLRSPGSVLIANPRLYWQPN